MPMGTSPERAQEDSAQLRMSTHESARQHRALEPSRHLSLFETNRSALIARVIVNQSNVGRHPRGIGPQGGSAGEAVGGSSWGVLGRSGGVLGRSRFFFGFCGRNPIWVFIKYLRNGL